MRETIFFTECTKIVLTPIICVLQSLPFDFNDSFSIWFPLEFRNSQSRSELLYIFMLIFIFIDDDDDEDWDLEDITLKMIFSKNLKCLLFFFKWSLISLKIKYWPWIVLFDLGWTFVVFNLLRLVMIYRLGVYVLCKNRVTKPWMKPIVFYNWKDVAIETEIP